MELTGTQVSGFWDKVAMSSPDNCWPWTAGQVGGTGYGKVTINNVTYRAHRVAYMLGNGDIPAGMVVRHTCNNPICVNPRHLILGIFKDNSQDMVRAGNSQFGTRNYAAKLTDQQVSAAREAVAHGATITSQAEKYHVTPAAMSRAVTGEGWKHVATPVPPPRQKPHNRVLTAELVYELRCRHIHDGETVSALSREIGVSVDTMHKAIKGKNWKNVPMPQTVNRTAN